MKLQAAQNAYSVTRRLHDQGGSLLVSLPKIWTDRQGLEAGDQVVIEFDSSEDLRLFPAKENGASKD